MPFDQMIQAGASMMGGMKQKPQMGMGQYKQKGGMRRGRPQMGGQMGAQQPQGLGPSMGRMGGMMRDRAMQQRMGGRGGAMGQGGGMAQGIMGMYGGGGLGQAGGQKQMGQYSQMGRPDMGYGAQQYQPQQQAPGMAESFGNQQLYGTSQPLPEQGIGPQPNMMQEMMARKRQAMEGPAY